MLLKLPVETDQPGMIKARINIINRTEDNVPSCTDNPEQRGDPEVEKLKQQIADLHLRLMEFQKDVPVITLRKDEKPTPATLTRWQRIMAWFRPQLHRGEGSS